MDKLIEALKAYNKRKWGDTPCIGLAICIMDDYSGYFEDGDDGWVDGRSFSGIEEAIAMLNNDLK